MEDPGYTSAAIAFEAAGARISTAPIDDEGMELRPASLRGAKLVYVTPAHQYPLGITMSLPRRLALLEWARQSGALVLSPKRAGLQLGFAAVDAAEIRRGVRELAAALETITEPSAIDRRSRNRH